MTKRLPLYFIVVLSFIGSGFMGCARNQSNSAPSSTDSAQSQPGSKKQSERVLSDINEKMSKKDVLEQWGSPDEWTKGIPGKGIVVVKGSVGINDEMPPNEAWVFEYQMPNEKKSCVLLTANAVVSVTDGACSKK